MINRPLIVTPIHSTSETAPTTLGTHDARRSSSATTTRLGRGMLTDVDQIGKVAVMPGGAHVAILANGQKLPVSRLQSRILRDRLLKL